MKKLLKYAFIAFLSLVALLTIVAIVAPPQDAVTVEDAVAEKVEPKQESKPEPKAEFPGKAEYDAIENGMTREEVEALFAKVDSFESESEVMGIQSVLVTYTANGELGANITVIYMDGVVESKSNYGIK